MENNLDRFIPQEEFYHEGKRQSYRRMCWRKNGNYVEVMVPAYKIGKHKKHTPQIIANIKTNKLRRTSGITSTHEYDFDMLKFLLDALNRS